MLQILQLSCTFGIWWNVMIHWYNDRRHIFTRQVKCRISVSRLPGIDSLPADLWISFDSSINNIYIFQPQTQQLEFLVKVLPNFHNLKKSNVSPSPEPIGKKWELTYRAVINMLFERTSAKPLSDQFKLCCHDYFCYYLFIDRLINLIAIHTDSTSSFITIAYEGVWEMGFSSSKIW